MNGVDLFTSGAAGMETYRLVKLFSFPLAHIALSLVVNLQVRHFVFAVATKGEKRFAVCIKHIFFILYGYKKPEIFPAGKIKLAFFRADGHVLKWQAFVFVFPYVSGAV